MSNVTDDRTSAAVLTQIARAVAGDRGSTSARVERLVMWMTSAFTWAATDYQQRTVIEIVARQQGNCAELARVLQALLAALSLRYRRVREINIQPPVERRERAAQYFVRKHGVSHSVFGLRHNDHVWLEVWDSIGSQWIPADPSVGAVGMREWVRRRLAFGARPEPPIVATATIVRAMIAPVAIIADRELRSERYLVTELNRFYEGVAAQLAGWDRWVEFVRALAPVAAGAMNGVANLHERLHLIDAIAEAYGALAREAITCGLAGTAAVGQSGELSEN